MEILVVTLLEASGVTVISFFVSTQIFNAFLNRVVSDKLVEDKNAEIRLDPLPLQMATRDTFIFGSPATFTKSSLSLFLTIKTSDFKLRVFSSSPIRPIPYTASPLPAGPASFRADASTFTGCSICKCLSPSRCARMSLTPSLTISKLVWAEKMAS